MWAKAPVLFGEYRALFLAVAAGALLLALAAASAPLFVSAAAGAALKHELASTTRFGAGVSVVGTGYFGAPSRRGRRSLTLERRDALLRDALADVPDVDVPVLGVLTASVVPGRSPGPSFERPVRLLFRTDALEHVERLAGRPGNGVWIADSIAKSMRLGPGDKIFFTNPSQPAGVPVESRVDGIYRALYGTRSTPYWRSLYHEIYPGSGDAPLPPTFAIASEGRVIAAASRLGLRADLHADWPLRRTDFALHEAERIERTLERFERSLNDANTGLGALMRCARCRRFYALDVSSSSVLSAAILRARDTASTLRGPADLLSTAGLLTALAVVAAGGAFAMGRRRTETALLFAYGMRAAAVGAKVALESVAPVAVGAAAGFGLAFALVTGIGPNGSIDPAELKGAARAAAFSVPPAVALLGLVAALSFRGRTGSRRPGAGLAASLPWELAVLAAAAFFFHRLRTHGAFVGDPDESTARPSLALLLFPFCFIGGCASLAARGLRGPLWRVRGRSDRLPPAAYLAVRRLAGSPATALLLAAASALALGIFVYAHTLVRSLEHAVELKSLVFVGSDVAGTTSADRNLPPTFPLPATKVTKMVEGGDLARVPADVMAVDPETLPRAVHWDARWASRPLTDIARDLRARGRRLPVVVVGPGPSARSLEIAGASIPVDIVERPRAFPGMYGGRPLVVVAREQLERFVAAAEKADPVDQVGNDTQIWVKGDPKKAIAALNASSVRPFPIVTAEEVRGTPSVAAVTNTFAFLKALGFGAGLLAVAGIVLYLQARQRGRAVSYALARRMGLTDGRHRRALALEVGTMLAVACVVGAALALVASRLVVADVDLQPSVPPRPLFAAPWRLLAATFFGLFVVAVLAAAVAHAVAKRANIGEEMRLGD
ncbi:MAG: hypothetical protein M3312_05655 [Actinomycetota bacterium]|nr:hypothetical protein [Actinomycetota bacterium]